MPSFRLRARATSRAAYAAAALALLATTACEDDDEPLIDDEPEIGSVVLSISPAAGGPVLYTWSGGATITPALRIPLGTSTINATVRDGSGATINDDLAADFELRMTASSNAIQFTRANTNPFAGAITATAAAGQTVTLCLYHRGENHCDFGAETTQIPVTIGG